MMKNVTVFSIKETPDLATLGYEAQNRLKSASEELMKELKDEGFSAYVKGLRTELNAMLSLLEKTHADRLSKLQKLEEIHQHKAVRTEEHKPVAYYTRVDDVRKFLYLAVHDDGQEIHVVHEKMMKLYTDKRTCVPTIALVKRTLKEVQEFADRYQLIINY